MTEAPIGAPACFAAASVFAHDSDICRQCSAYDACSAACVETLETIRTIINVDDLLRRHQAARKVATKAIKKADEKRASQASPGMPEPPLSAKPIARKTKVVKVEFELSTDEQDVIARLPVKPRELALRLTKNGELDALRKDLQAGINTFAESGPSFLRVAMSLLLAGGFTKGGLCEAFERDLKWTKGTAQSHVGIVCALLAAFRFVRQQEDGSFVVAPATA